MAQEQLLPHRLILTERKSMTVTGVTEIVSFDESTAVLKTAQGELVIHGQGLQLKDLSLEDGQVAVEGTVFALIYQHSRKGSLRRRLG